MSSHSEIGIGEPRAGDPLAFSTIRKSATAPLTATRRILFPPQFSEKRPTPKPNTAPVGSVERRIAALGAYSDFYPFIAFDRLKFTALSKNKTRIRVGR